MCTDQAAQLTVSVGAAQLIPGVGTPESVLAAARIACITAKERGRNRVAAFLHDDVVRLNERRRIEMISHIQQALQDDRLILYSQAIRSLSTRKKGQHFEILLRGIDDDDKLIEPNEFMSYAEQQNNARNRSMGRET